MLSCQTQKILINKINTLSEVKESLKGFILQAVQLHGPATWAFIITLQTWDFKIHNIEIAFFCLCVLFKLRCSATKWIMLPSMKTIEQFLLPHRTVVSFSLSERSNHQYQRSQDRSTLRRIFKTRELSAPSLCASHMTEKKFVVTNGASPKA